MVEQRGKTEDVQRVHTSRAETKAYYNRIATLYDLLAQRSEGPIRLEGLELLKVQPGERVLELGFGTGRGLVTLANGVGSDGRVYGRDLSQRMLKIARERLERLGLADRTELQTGDAVSLPFSADVMDAVFMGFTLELFDTPEIAEVLGECFRVLKPKGRIVVVSLCKDSDAGLALSIYEYLHHYFPKILDCRPIYCKEMVENSGFQILTTRKKKIWGLPVEIVLAAKTSAGRKRVGEM